MITIDHEVFKIILDKDHFFDLQLFDHAKLQTRILKQNLCLRYQGIKIDALD